MAAPAPAATTAASFFSYGGPTAFSEGLADSLGLNKLATSVTSAWTAAAAKPVCRARRTASNRVLRPLHSRRPQRGRGGRTAAALTLHAAVPCARRRLPLRLQLPPR
jgi:hypothetical protein